MSELYRSSRTIVSRCCLEGRDVIVKTPAAAIPAARELARYRWEFNLLQSCPHLGVVVAYELQESGGLVRLILEPCAADGRALIAWLLTRSFSPDDVLEVMLATAQALEAVHGQGVVHTAVTPSHLVWSPESRQLRLIDFSRASRLAHGPADPKLREGSLHYLAPEQTGRLNRGVDHRADYYALGATAWTLLTGRPLFGALADPLAVVHAHLAQEPLPVHSLRPDVPPALSAVVATLLAKDPEARYQSAGGLAADLLRCRQEPGGFELRETDRAIRFVLPEALYGRDRERQLLLDALGEAGRGSRLLAFVSGPAGVGKSRLAQELREPTRASGGCYAAGRHEMLQPDRPHQAILEALREALRSLLTQSEAQLEQARSLLSQALGSNAGVLTPLLPELDSLLPKQPPIPQLNPQESRNRTFLALSSLVGALASHAPPLVLVLEDVHRADAASAELIRFLAGDPYTCGTGGLLLVVSYRSSEKAAPLNAVWRDLEGVLPLVHVRVAELEENSTCRLVADACQRRLQEAAPLASLLHARTAGNPFFLRALLARLEREGQLLAAGTGWSWDLEALRTLEVSENVVELLVGALRELPVETLELLKLAAALGTRFTASRLALAAGQPVEQAARALWPALERALVHPLSSGHELAAFGSPDEACYRFAHDRVQEAAYGLVPVAERPALHLRLGRLLRAQEGATEGSERLLELVEHLARGLAAMAGPEERHDFARLALEAGLRASAAGALESSLMVLEAGYQALGEERWVADYKLTLRLVHESARAALGAGVADVFESRLAEAMARARCLLDEFPAWKLRLQHLMEENRMAETCRQCEAFLSRSGRSRPGLLSLGVSLWRGRHALKGPAAGETLMALPENPDPLEREVHELLALTLPAFGLAMQHRVPLLTLEVVGSLLERGVTPGGVPFFLSYGMLLCTLGFPEPGRRFAELALELTERMGRPDLWPRLALFARVLVASWTTPIAQIHPYLQSLFARGLEVGDTWAASTAAEVRDCLEYFAGSELTALAQRLEQTEQLLAHYRPADTRRDHEYIRRCVRTLVDPQAVELPDWAKVPLTWESNRVGELVLRTLQLQLAQLYGRYSLASQFARAECPALRGSASIGPIEMFYWTYALVALFHGLEAGWVTWVQARASLRRGRKRLARWVGSMPARRYRVRWVQAAEYRALGRTRESLGAYEEAAGLAREFGFRQDAALICQQACEYCQQEGLTRAARGFREEALAGFRQWGAASRIPPDESSSSQGPLGSLDLETVVRASRILSAQFGLPQLLRAMLDLAVENAGAETGWLVLVEDDSFLVGAQASAGNPTSTPAQPLKLDGPEPPLPLGVLRYAARSREPLLLEDASSPGGTFRADPYVRAHRPRSILCVPLQHGGAVSGLIYLENNRLPGLFTKTRTDALRTLSAQMALCLENAQQVERTQAQHAQMLLDKERLHSEELRSQALQVRQEALAAFLAIASHDLKNPLSTIGVWARQLEPGPVRASIERACTRAGTLVSGYLDVLALEAGGELRLNRRSCQLDELIENEIDAQLQSLDPNLRALAALEWDLEPVVVSADPDRLHQVLANLVGNALKYCGPSTPIRVRLQVLQDRARVTVEDEGPGIPAEGQAGLFEAFQRRDSQQAGSGLGLWICKVIVEAHGGRLGVESQAGEGSRFWFVLDLEPDPAGR